MCCMKTAVSLSLGVLHGCLSVSAFCLEGRNLRIWLMKKHGIFGGVEARTRHGVFGKQKQGESCFYHLCVQRLEVCDYYLYYCCAHQDNTNTQIILYLAIYLGIVVLVLTSACPVIMFLRRLIHQLFLIRLYFLNDFVFGTTFHFLELQDLNVLLSRYLSLV